MTAISQTRSSKKRYCHELLPTGKKIVFEPTYTYMYSYVYVGSKTILFPVLLPAFTFIKDL